MPVTPKDDLPNRTCKRYAAGAASALALTLFALAPAPAAAQESEETFEQSIIRGLLGGNSRPDIDYRERSPLVVPPTRELPAPDDAAAVVGNPAWPQDPDQQRAASAAGKSQGPVIDLFRESERPLTPRELRRGARAGAGRPQGPVITPTDDQMTRPLTPAELGETRSLFGLATGAGRPAQSATFTGEPSRSRLTQPPTGYQTPSSGQPYAAPKGSGSWFSIPSLFDRTTQSKDR